MGRRKRSKRRWQTRIHHTTKARFPNQHSEAARSARSAPPRTTAPPKAPVRITHRSGTLAEGIARLAARMLARLAMYRARDGEQRALAAACAMRIESRMMLQIR